MTRSELLTAQNVLIGIIHFVAFLVVFNLSIVKSGTLCLLVIFCFALEIGQRRLAQTSLILLFLIIGVASDTIPPLPQWGPTIQTSFKMITTAVAAVVVR